ncbi:hypothetical protein [Bacteriovorax sp. Seq25_V]|uniref:hypothetical protein n=1 Tax=Bacteriovorax sp. Seq25_V TaxID=1201288 RepID=UPI0003F6C018|nr:hypothetical protein [Bacteriovorax sp. Seq25_V]
MKKIILLSLFFTTVLATGKIQASTNKNTLAFCWQSKDKQWWCDGPDQILWSSEDTLKRALKRSGCESYSKTIAWAGDSKLGHLFVCNKKYSKFDRDIREKYNIKGY